LLENTKNLASQIAKLTLAAKWHLGGMGQHGIPIISNVEFCIFTLEIHSVVSSECSVSLFMSRKCSMSNNGHKFCLSTLGIYSVSKLWLIDIRKV